MWWRCVIWCVMKTTTTTTTTKIFKKYGWYVRFRVYVYCVAIYIRLMQIINWIIISNHISLISVTRNSETKLFNQFCWTGKRMLIAFSQIVWLGIDPGILDLNRLLANVHFSSQFVFTSNYIPHPNIIIFYYSWTFVSVIFFSLAERVKLEARGK